MAYGLGICFDIQGSADLGNFSFAGEFHISSSSASLKSSFQPCTKANFAREKYQPSCQGTVLAPCFASTSLL